MSKNCKVSTCPPSYLVVDIGGKKKKFDPDGVIRSTFITNRMLRREMFSRRRRLVRRDSHALNFEILTYSHSKRVEASRGLVKRMSVSVVEYLRANDVDFSKIEMCNDILSSDRHAVFRSMVKENVVECAVEDEDVDDYNSGLGFDMELYIKHVIG